MKSLDRKFGEVMEQTKLCYNSVVEGYEAYYEIGVKIHDEYNDRFFELLGHGSRRILEVGPGIGDETVHLVQAGHHVVCVDIADKLLTAMKARVSNVVAIVNSIFEVKFIPDSFDAAVSLLVYHLFPKKDAANFLARLSTFIRPNGLLLISTNIDDVESEKVIRKREMVPSLPRFKRYVTRDIFTAEIENAGYEILNTYERTSYVVEGKAFMTVIARNIKS